MTLWTPNQVPHPKKEDPTGCTHKWEKSNISYLIHGVDDYQCKGCGAHGQRRKGESLVEYCHGGKVQGA